MKVAIVDLDGVVANVDARFAEAEKAKQAFLQDTEARIEALFSSHSGEQQAVDLYWRTVFNPELVYLDTLIPGTNDALNRLIDEGYTLIFLTSRPEAMRAETLEWLSLYVFVKAACDLWMKPPAFQYVKTTVWKAGTIQMLTTFYGATDLLIIEDEQANINELLKYVQTWDICKSLGEAVAKLNGTWVEPDPFLPEE